MDEIHSIDNTLEKIKTLYKQFENSHQYIRNYNSIYDFAYTSSISKFNKIRSNSYKILITNLISDDLAEIDKFVTKITHKIVKFRKFTLSELAHSKSKEIEFEMDNPFFFKKLRKDYRSLNNELFKLDDKVLNEEIEDEEKIALEFENVIERFKNLEYELADEKKSGVFGTIGKFAVWGIPILIGLYQLIAMQFFTINLYIPLVAYIVALFIFYVVLKSINDIKLIYISIKNNKYRIFPLIFIFILIIFMTLIAVKDPPVNDIILPLFMALFSFIYILVLFYKETVENTKKKIIQNELNILAIKYGVED